LRNTLDRGKALLLAIEAPAIVGLAPQWVAGEYPSACKDIADQRSALCLGQE
jgi:hypothetical protein